MTKLAGVQEVSCWARAPGVEWQRKSYRSDKIGQEIKMRNDWVRDPGVTRLRESSWSDMTERELKKCHYWARALGEA